MKIFIDIFDFILLVIILGLMLPFPFSTANALLDVESFGFEQLDDKTMKLADGETLISELSGDDNFTAAEIMLMIKTAEQNIIRQNCFELPDGQIITVNENYYEFEDNYMNIARNALNSSRKYVIQYDYTADLWRIAVL